MRVRTKLTISVAMMVAISLGSFLVILLTVGRLGSEREKYQLIDQIESESHLLISVIQNYLLYHSDRPLAQMRLQHDILLVSVSQPEFREWFSSQDARQLVSAVNSLGDMVGKLEGNLQGQVRRIDQDSFLNSQAENRLAANVLIKAEVLARTAGRLQAISDRNFQGFLTRGIYFSLAAILIMAFAISISTIWIYRSTSPQLEKLAEGAAQIGAGNYDFILDSKADDEFGFTARAFDEMAGKLKSFHEELELRVEKRTAELQNTQLQLVHAEKLSSIGELSASIAHEFNNPLYGLILVLRDMLRQECSRESTEDLNLALDECYRMQDLVSNLQDFYRPSSSIMSSFDLNASIEAVLLLYRNRMHEKNITLIRSFNEQLPEITATGDQIKQVLLNLLNNATDACISGDVIEITTGENESGFVFFSVKDSGKGMSQKDQDKIFEPFYSTKSSVKGVGLGMPICLGIVNRHGGTLTVDSASGKGTTLTVCLPKRMRKLDEEA